MKMERTTEGPTTHQRPRRAFSLLELIVVLVVLGLIAAVAIPTFARTQEKALAEADRASLAAVARDATALIALEQGAGSVVTIGQVAEALSDCAACTATAHPGSTASSGDPWRLVGFDYGTGPHVDPGAPEGTTAGTQDQAWTYGHIFGEGWGTSQVHLVMATRADGTFAHATIGVGGSPATWVDSNPGTSEPVPEPDPPQITELTFDSYNDTNGLFGHFGTLVGGGTWTNPAGSTLYGASSSANHWLSRLTDRGNAADYWEGGAGTWVTWDLGLDRTFEVESYTLRSGSYSKHYPTTWRIQGSNNGTTWVDIDTRSSDSTLGGQNRWGRFAPNGDTGPFRWLRLDNHNQQTIFAEIEFYGVLTEQTPSATPAGAIDLPLTSLAPNATGGMFHTIGVAAGDGTWTNPIADGTVRTVSTSTHSSNLPHRIADRSNTSYYETASTNVTTTFHLGPTRRVAVEEIVIHAHNGTGLHPPHTFTLEGSTDGTTWMPLLSVEGLQWEKNPRALFSATGAGARTPFQMLRLTTPPRSVFDELEIYGWLVDVPPPATPAGTTPALMTAFTDMNDLFWQVGVAAGGGTWVNPASHLSVSGSAKDITRITDRNASNANYTEMGPTGLVRWNFGARKVAVTNYTLRRGSYGRYIPDAWRIEGSDDGSNWTVIDSRTGMQSYTSIGTSGWTYFEAAGPGAGQEFQYVRLVNAQGTNLIVDELRLYGWIR